MAVTLEWEQVEYRYGEHSVQRASVPGGWLVKLITWVEGLPRANSLTFVPDPDHTWGAGYKLGPIDIDDPRGRPPSTVLKV